MKTTTQIFTDEAGKHRLRVTARNGNILQSSCQGYFNKIDLKTAEIRAAKAILTFYGEKH